MTEGFGHNRHELEDLGGIRFAVNESISTVPDNAPSLRLPPTDDEEAEMDSNVREPSIKSVS